MTIEIFYSMITILQEVSRLLIGLNCGKALDTIDLPESTKSLSSGHNFDLQVGIYPGYTMVVQFEILGLRFNSKN